jgi:hypothetical protein
MIFENCIIQAPDGVNLSRCGRKKFRWYLNNGLADVVSDDPPTIRLRFEPSGREGVNDPYLLEGKPNICVVCGDESHLTRHHIIPYCFIRHMALEYKVDIIRDIFPLCRPCHNEYEKFSWDKREELLNRFDISIENQKTKRSQSKRASSAAHTIINHQDKIPENRKIELFKIIHDFLGKDHVTEQELVDLQECLSKPNINISRMVAEKVQDYNEFAKEWRTHFVNTMQPKFMPEAWKIDRKTENVWISRHMLSQKVS